ncbi:MAG: EamA family transporter [Gammaproteobacteria bacterium]|nr:MAG: EamA family transporter [Gammaproteobacteria bacterium]
MSVPAAFVAVIIIWSTTPLAIKWSGDGAGFLFGVTSRMTLGAVVCLAIIWLFRLPLPMHRRARKTYMVGTLAVYAAMLSVYWGAQYIPSGLVSVVFGLTPIVTSVLASYVLKEQSMTAAKVAGMFLGVIGLLLIFASSFTPNDDTLYGVAGVFMAVLLHSCSTVWMKRLDTDIPAMSLTTGTLLLSVPLYLLTYAIFADGVADAGDIGGLALTPRAGASIVYLGVVGSVVGYSLFFYIIKHVSAAKVGMLPLLTPLLALFIGRYANNEVISVQVWMGTLMIMSGMLLHLLPVLLAVLRKDRKSQAKLEGSAPEDMLSAEMLIEETIMDGGILEQSLLDGDPVGPAKAALATGPAESARQIG